MSEKEYDYIKKAASMSLPATAADLASKPAIGERIDELTQVIEPDSSVMGTIFRAGSITHAIRQVGHLVRTPAGRCVLTVRAGHWKEEQRRS